MKYIYPFNPNGNDCRVYKAMRESAELAKFLAALADFTSLPQKNNNSKELPVLLQALKAAIVGGTIK